VTLGASVPAGGNNRLVAVVESAGATGPTSEIAVLQLTTSHGRGLSTGPVRARAAWR
jgi:hypothetical protein